MAYIAVALVQGFYILKIYYDGDTKEMVYDQADGRFDRIYYQYARDGSMARADGILSALWPVPRSTACPHRDISEKGPVL